MLSKIDLDTIHAALTELRATQSMAADNGLRALARLIESVECNGWSNWETWNVKLWIDNEQATYTAARWLVEDNSVEDGSAAAALKDYAEQLCFGDEMAATMANDLCNGALGRVNWQEIALSIASEMEAA